MGPPHGVSGGYWSMGYGSSAWRCRSISIMWSVEPKHGVSGVGGGSEYGSSASRSRSIL